MKKIFFIYSLFILFVLTSCRPTGDELLSFGQNDTQAFYLAEQSYEEEFKALWLAMNENYGIWDYEEEFGLDWDAVYSTYLPQFAALDQKASVSDEELKALYLQFTDSLHDGHMALQVKNLSTGNYVTLNPNGNRQQRERGDVVQRESTNIPKIDYYRSANVDPHYAIRCFDGTSSAAIMIEMIDSTYARVVRGVTAYQQLVEDHGGPDETNQAIYDAAGKLKADMDSLMKTPLTNTAVGEFNQLCATYSIIGDQIGVPLTPVEEEIMDDNLKNLRFALFEGNIAYIRIGGFNLSPYLEPSEVPDDDGSQFYAYYMSVRRVWHHWFDTIQVLHANGTLGGVIFDVRNNNGGLVNDYKFALGALLPSGGWNSHLTRLKNGCGRLDYAPIMPFMVQTYEGEHAVISEEPIVVIANSQSISMAENTTYGVKSQPNGYFIGTRTYGALSALNTDPEEYSQNYAGAFGVRDVTPIYGYIPKYVCLYGPNHRPVEGHGFDPDMEVPLDIDLLKSQGRDSQLEAALDYINQNKN